MSRLADILQNEYKTKGVFSGVTSAVGKRALEKLDIRNALFSGGGIGSVVGTKIFGKGYSGTRGSKTTTPTNETLSSGPSPLLQEININSKITAKNSIALPAMAKQMNIMQKNIAKLVKIWGGSPSTKADSFFSNAKFRENQYESQFNAGTKPTKVEMKKEKSEGGFLGTIGSLIGSVVSGIGTTISSSIEALGSVLKFALGTLGTILSASILGKAIGKIIPGIPTGKTSAGTPPTSKTPPVTPPGTPSGKTTPSSNIPNQKPGFQKTAEDLIREKAAARSASERSSAKAAARITSKQFAKNAIAAVTGPIGGAWMTALFLYDVANLLAPSEQAALETHTKTLESIEDDLDNVDESYSKGEITENGYITALEGLKRKAETIKQRLEALRDIIKKRMEEERKNTSPLKAEQASIRAIDNATISTTPTNDNQKKLGMMYEGAKNSGNAASSNTTPSKVSMLDLIASGESGRAGYDAANKGKAGDMPNGLPGLSNMSVGDVMRLQSNKEIFAAGRYQIIPDTLAGLISGKYGNIGVSLNDKFDAATQDKLATALINKRLKQGGDDPIKQQYALSQEFASIANPYTGKSYYEGKGNNKASISTSQIQASLSGTGTKIDGQTLASASQSGLQISQNMLSSEDLSALGSIMGAQTMINGGGGLSQVATASKSTPYQQEFYENLVNRVAL